MEGPRCCNGGGDDVDGTTATTTAGCGGSCCGDSHTRRAYDWLRLLVVFWMLEDRHTSGAEVLIQALVCALRGAAAAADCCCCCCCCCLPFICRTYMYERNESMTPRLLGRAVAPAFSPTEDRRWIDSRHQGTRGIKFGIWAASSVGMYV